MQNVNKQSYTANWTMSLISQHTELHLTAAFAHFKSPPLLAPHKSRDDGCFLNILLFLLNYRHQAQIPSWWCAAWPPLATPSQTQRTEAYSASAALTSERSASSGTSPLTLSDLTRPDPIQSDKIRDSHTQSSGVTNLPLKKKKRERKKMLTLTIPDFCIRFWQSVQRAGRFSNDVTGWWYRVCCRWRDYTAGRFWFWFCVKH